ncbi:ABC superfamily ATP binding cassette transporter, ABC domain protein [Clostridioides difficile]|nr:ABC superfamily ATP binding cassette transporter, ABC domain protein [Clostridioides difficile]EQL06791.1 ABC superfamily ATP binding cassette transporter, ABC domain protein [Clostridioides difficile CD86]
MLKTNNLSVGYNNKVVISNINVEVKNGEILCLLEVMELEKLPY